MREIHERKEKEKSAKYFGKLFFALFRAFSPANLV
jgi:hypothetical protein